ncbi:MAG: hypothetical protein ACTS4T_00550 [Candidatus Hodgkinia cicadicola]
MRFNINENIKSRRLNGQNFYHSKFNIGIQCFGKVNATIGN